MLTGFSCYVVKAERAFLKFADFVLDDNLKNVVQSGGATFYVVDMEKFAVAQLGEQVPFWRPMYVKDSDMGKLIDWKRGNILMVRDFLNMDFQSRVAAAKADQYLKGRLSDLRERKKTQKERVLEADRKKRKHD